MLKQKIYITKYNWEVYIYYSVNSYYINEILDKLRNLHSNEEDLNDAYLNMISDKLNTGLTYSNLYEQKSVIVISKTSTPSQFINSLFHEVTHLVCHIVEKYKINPFDEEAAYLAGSIGQLIYPIAKEFLCNCHNK